MARWGRITWRGQAAQVSFSTRSGNSARPDKTWSDWSEPLADSQNSLIRSPNARYIQWRAELTGPGAVVENVSIAYLPQNNPPVVRSINVTTQACRSASGAESDESNSSATRLQHHRHRHRRCLHSAPARPRRRFRAAASSQIQSPGRPTIPTATGWSTRVYFRGEDETRVEAAAREYDRKFAAARWRRVGRRPLLFPRGGFGPPLECRRMSRAKTELVSSPVLIDNTPPVVTLSAPRVTTDDLEVDADVEDRTLRLRRCEYSLDAGPWIPVEAADGVTDSPREQFHIAIEQAPPRRAPAGGPRLRHRQQRGPGEGSSPLEAHAPSAC